MNESVNQDNSKLSKSERAAQQLHFSKELTMQRLLLLITMVAYPFLGYVRTYIEHVESTNILLQRLTFAVLIIVCLILSYKVKVFKENFYFVIRSFVYIGFSHLTAIALMYGFSFSHTLGLIIVLLGTSFVFKEIKKLIIYLLYAATIVTITAFVAPKSELTPLLVLSLFYSLCFIIYITINLRLKSQKIIKKSEATISALIENAAGLIWSIDSHYNYIAFNNAFKTLNKSLAKDDLKIGDPTTKILFSPELTQQLSEAYQKVFKGENVNFKAEITLNQKTKYYSFSLSPIKVEYTKTIGVTVFGTDLTSERNQEIALIKAKEYAEELTKSKQHFLSNMSHEIRTPLNGIIGFTSILLKNETLSEEQQKYLQAIKNSGDILLVIINDILDLSKMEAGKMTFESIPISLPNIVEEAIETFVLKSEEKNIQILKNIEIDAAFDFIGDPVRIAQVLLNILSNAIKFTPQNGTITIQSKILSSTEEESIFQISIEDSGIGIEQEKLDLIFQPFVQTNEDTTRKFGGTGLGLSIVQKIIELMNGSIKVTSIIGKGSTFIIEIPLKRQTNAKEKLKTEVYQEQQSTFTPSDVRILLAEDNVINQLLAQAVIGQYGFQLTTVENGALAADLLESEHFDLILMDLMMPVMDGYEATRNIRQMANEVKKKVPIIALTADVTTMNAEKCKDFGMDDYLSKPFDSKTLYDKIAFLLNKT